MYRFISNMLLLLSSFLGLLYYSPLKFRWPLALLVELWPYCGVIPWHSTDQERGSIIDPPAARCGSS